MPQPTLETLITTIILPSLIEEPDARLKGTEKLLDHLEEESLSQIKIQPDTPKLSGLPELALTFNSECNCELDSHADICVLGKHAHIFMDH